MSDFLSKLSSYHLFNYLIPGVVFGLLARQMVPYSVGTYDIVTAAFLAYFVGLVVSRFGSLVLEPILKYSKFMEFWDYQELATYTKDDSHLSVLYEVSNMYRTMASGFLLLILLKLYLRVEVKYPALHQWDPTTLTVLLLVVFLFSYKKQTRYMIDRISADKAAPGKI